MIKVTYQWTPPKCEHCKVFGHLSDSYSKLSTGDQSVARQSKAVGGQDQDKVWRVVGHKGKAIAMEEDQLNHDKGFSLAKE